MTDEQIDALCDQTPPVIDPAKREIAKEIARKHAPKVLASVIFAAYGQIGAFDEEGQQVPEWQLASHYRVLLAMDAAGVLTPQTLVSLPWDLTRPVPWETLREERAAWFRREA